MTREEIIALGEEAYEWAEQHLQCTGEYHPDYHDVRDIRFAELVAKAAFKDGYEKGVAGYMDAVKIE